MLCTTGETECALADPWWWRLWLVRRCLLTERGTSTPETCLRFCLSQVLRTVLWRLCQDFVIVWWVVLLALRPNGRAAKWNMPVFQPRILVAAPWLGLVDLPCSCWAMGALWQIVKLQTKPFPFPSFPLITFPWIFQSPFNTQAQPYLLLWVFWRLMAVVRHMGDIRNRLISPSKGC